jgi:hypothetical protein
LSLLDIFNNYLPTFDIASILPLGVLLAIGSYTRRARIDPDMRLSLAGLLTLSLLFSRLVSYDHIGTSPEDNKFLWIFETGGAFRSQRDFLFSSDRVNNALLSWAM